MITAIVIKTRERTVTLTNSARDQEDPITALDNSITPDQVKFVVPYLESLSPRTSLNRLVEFVPVSADSQEKTIIDVFENLNVAFKIDLNAYDPTFVYKGLIYFNKLQDPDQPDTFYSYY